LVREVEMIEVLRARPDLTAVLDVTHPEPPVSGSPLFTLPNVFLTPHLAGSMGPECRRMGAYMAADLKRYLAAEPMLGEVRREAAAMLA
jgi:phosphoglycerate dehydrogenase-like enzyme